MPNTDISTSKWLFKSVIIIKLAKLFGLDIKEFYLNSDMDEYEYIWLPWRMPPQYFIDENKIERLFINNRILIKNFKGMYDIPQKGRLAYIAIIKHMQLLSIYENYRVIILFSLW